MGITVISALPATGLPGMAAASGTADEGASGGFAALLSGELFAQMDIIAELGGIVSEMTNGKPTSNDRLVIEDKPAAEDKPTIENEPDTALLASLFGHPASAELSPKNIVTPTATPAIAAGPAVVVNPQIGASNQAMPEALIVKSPSQETVGVFEKLMSNSREAATAAAPSLPAANIAGETDAGETPATVVSQFAANSANSAASANAGQTANTTHQSVAAPLHSPTWPQQFGDRVVWLARNEQQMAQLNINPPQLGPVQVTLKLSGDQASILFASPHAEVRQAIESAMPQLRDMLSAAGINLGQANVGPNLQQQRGDTPFGNANGTRFADENAILPANEKGASAAGATVVQRGRGLVDLFA